MKYIAKILNEYALINPNKNIVIILNSLRKDKKIPIQEEIDFFKKYSPILKLRPINLLMIVVIYQIY